MGVFRGRHIEADDFGRLADEIGIGAFAPRFASRKVDFVGPQEPPDILLVHVAKRPGEQRRRPVGQARRRLGVKQRQNTAARLGSVLRRRATPAFLTEAGDPILGVTDPPFGGRAGGAADIPRNCPRRCATCRKQHDPRLQARPVFALPRTRQALQFDPLLARQNNRRGFRNDLAAHAALNHDSVSRDSGY